MAKTIMVTKEQQEAAKSVATEQTVATKEPGNAAKRGEALTKLVAYIMANKPEGEQGAALEAACKTVRPSYFGLTERGPVAGDGLNPSYRRFFQLFGAEPKVGDTATLTDAFGKYRMGPREMRIMAIELIKYPVDAKPVYWLTASADGEQYTVTAIGPDVPENWKGYLPKALNGGKYRTFNNKAE